MFCCPHHQYSQVRFENTRKTISPDASCGFVLSGKPNEATEDSIYSHLASITLRGLEAAASQAAVRRGATAADDLQLFFGAVRSVQQLLNELLQPHFGVGFTCRRLLKELVDLGNFPEGREGNSNETLFKLRGVLSCSFFVSLSHRGANYTSAEPRLWRKLTCSDVCVLHKWSLYDCRTHFLKKKTSLTFTPAAVLPFLHGDYTHRGMATEIYAQHKHKGRERERRGIEGERGREREREEE